MRRLALIFVPAALLVGLPTALAGSAGDPGVTSDTILLGATVPLTGDEVAYAAVARGSNAYFQYVNDHGGVRGRKIRYQLAKIERKAGREALRRNARAARDAASLYGLVYPERHLQERLYSILPFIAKHGTYLVERLYEVVQLDCPDHRLVVG